MMDKKNSLVVFLKSRPDDELICIHNEYCKKTNKDDMYAYFMAEFDEQYQGSFSDIFDNLYDKSKFDTQHEYFWHSVYGIKSGNASDVVRELVYIGELADHILDNAHEYRGINNQLDYYLN